MARAGPRPASRLGSRAPMASPHGRVKSSSPRVASEDSAKPNDRASHGSTTSTTTIAAPSTGGPAERRDRLRPIRPIAPIAAARTTLGSGRASTTNPARATSASAGRTPSRHAEEDAEAEDQAGDHGDVAAADRGEVGHPGGSHGRGEVFGGLAGVADDETGQQPSGVGRRVLDGRPQPRAQPLGPRGHRARRGADAWRAAHRQRGDPVVGALGGPEPTPHLDRRPPARVGRCSGRP